MATRTLVEYLCGNCGTEDARPRRLTVQGKVREVDACEGCWEVIERLVADGRKLPRQRRSG